MTKGIIYYTDNRLGEPIFSVVQKQILNSGLPIVIDTNHEFRYIAEDLVEWTKKVKKGGIVDVC